MLVLTCMAHSFFQGSLYSWEYTACSYTEVTTIQKRNRKRFLWLCQKGELGEVIYTTIAQYNYKTNVIARERVKAASKLSTLSQEGIEEWGTCHCRLVQQWEKNVICHIRTLALGFHSAVKPRSWWNPRASQ